VTRSTDYHEPTEEEYDSRLRQLIKPVDEILKSNGFFSAYSSFPTPQVRSQVADTNLSWLLCDLGQSRHWMDLRSGPLDLELDLGYSRPPIGSL
jgi:hypothetical protein